MRYTLISLVAMFGLIVNALAGNTGGRVRRDVEDDLSVIKDGVASLTDAVASLTDAVLKIDRQVKFLDACTKCLPDSRVRLVGGSATYGRVQVWLNGEWGAVCDDVKENGAHPGSGANLAVVVCRSLGLHGGEYVMPGSDPSLELPDDDPTPFLMDELQCDGTENTIFHCKRNPDGDHDCSHGRGGEDLIVRCRP